MANVTVYTSFKRDIANAATGASGGMANSLEMGKTISNPNSNTVGTITSSMNLAGSAASLAQLGKTSSGLAIGATAVKIGNNINNGKSASDTIGGLTVGDVLGTAAAVAAVIPGGQVVALGLTVAGLGYTVWSVAQNNGKDISIKDLVKMHPDNYRQDDWGNPDNFLGDYKDNLNRDGKYHVYDPLVLDLDGDGIETVGTQGYNGALWQPC